MKVDIELTDALDGKFARVQLCFNDKTNIRRKVDLNIDFTQLYDFSHDTTSVKFDFFVISALVYGVDNLVSREVYAEDGWTREIEVSFPVINLTTWQGKEESLQSVLDFLTGDIWTVQFEQSTISDYFIPRSNRRLSNIPQYDKASIKKASLFSGGLDSLIGIIDTLEQMSANEKIILISHFDSKSPGPKKDQRVLLQRLNPFYQDRLYQLQTRIFLSRKDENDARIPIIETNYRSRSILFIGIGIYVGQTPELIIPENGTISINFPLTISRIGSLSTRTTHPHFIKLLQAFLINTGITTQLETPYKDKTKGEMVQECLNQDALKASYEPSVSCGKRGRKKHWTHRTGTDHCGVCMPCIYRRAALYSNNWDDQLYGIELLSMIESKYDLPSLASYLNKNLTRSTIKRDLIVNSNIPESELNDYSDLVLRSRSEVYNWLSSSNEPYIRTLFNIP